MSVFLIAYYYSSPRSMYLGKSLSWCCDYEYWKLFLVPFCQPFVVCISVQYKSRAHTRFWGIF